MSRVLVTVQREGETGVRDLELPADVPVGRWLSGLIGALNWPTREGYTLRARGPAAQQPVPIDANGTLADAGVRDGYWLVVVPGHLTPPGPTGGEGPVEGWIPITSVPSGISAGSQPQGIEEEEEPVVRRIPITSVPSGTSAGPQLQGIEEQAPEEPAFPSQAGPGGWLDDWQSRAIEDEGEG